MIKLSVNGQSGVISFDVGDIITSIRKDLDKDGYVLPCDGRIITDISKYPDYKNLVDNNETLKSILNKGSIYYTPDFRECALVGVGTNSSDNNKIQNHDPYQLLEFKDDCLQTHTHNYTGMILRHRHGGDRDSRRDATTSINTGRTGDVTRGKRKGIYYYVVMHKRANVVFKYNNEYYSWLPTDSILPTINNKYTKETRFNECVMVGAYTPVNYSDIPTFSASVQYYVGDKVFYNSFVYRCITNHKGNWNSSRFTLDDDRVNTTDNIATHDIYQLLEFKDDCLQEHTHSVTKAIIESNADWSSGNFSGLQTLVTSNNTGRTDNVTRGKRKGVYFRKSEQKYDKRIYFRKNNETLGDWLVGTIVTSDDNIVDGLLCDGEPIPDESKYQKLKDLIDRVIELEGDNPHISKLKRDGVYYTPDFRECALVGVGSNSSDTIQNHDIYQLLEFKDDCLQEHTHKYYSISEINNVYAGSEFRNETSKLSGYTQTSTNTGRKGDVTRGKRKGIYFYILY